MSSDISVVADEHGRPLGEIEVDRNERNRRDARFLAEMYPLPSRGEKTPADGPCDVSGSSSLESTVDHDPQGHGVPP